MSISSDNHALKSKGGLAMATAEQIKTLIKAHYDGNEEQFKTAVLQIAANEAKLGHTKLARDFKELALTGKGKKANIIRLNNANSMFLVTTPSVRINDLVVSDDLRARIDRILNEFIQRGKLNKFGFVNRRKILLEGAPGTGKTMTASVIASELNLPLYTIQMDKLMTKYMGETSAKLRQIFDSIEESTGVYFFDEFDAIGADRNLDNEVGEIRRVLNSFLQFIEQDCSDSIIIAATNNRKILDQALFRRFDDVLHYELPDIKAINHLLEIKLSNYATPEALDDSVIQIATGLSQADIAHACDDALKEAILSGKSVDKSLLREALTDRHSAYKGKEA
jgi:SpoVK/Ycf46/Vps4 family AAA+-type ATPase